MYEISIRQGTKEDLPQVLELVKELAIYEKAPEQVTNTVAQMEEDGFGEHPVYGMIVADCDGVLIGISIYYFRYSTWKGKRLYLEDIIVTKKERGMGIGKLLFKHTMKKSIELKCVGMTWQVLDWNEPAIHFYTKYDSAFDSEWTNCSLEAGEIEALLNR